MTVFYDQLAAEKAAQNIDSLRVLSKEMRTVLEEAPPAYTTLTLLEDAAEKFGWSGERSMAAAQALFEHGLITYPRTDATHVVQEAVEAARLVVRERYGRRALKTISVQERFLSPDDLHGAHEAIRPTDPQQYPEEALGLLPDPASLYRLIWQRLIASQMQAARVQVIDVELETL
jgi:DNA topoisomerase-1